MIVRRRSLPLIVALAAGAIALLRIAAGIPIFSHTVDEPANVGAAVPLYEARKHIENVQHPPISRLVAGMPLILSGVHALEFQNEKIVQNDLESWGVGNRLLVQSSQYWTLLKRARAAMLVFPALALLYTYLLGAWLGGRWAGALALAFFATDPTLLGHGMWIATDGAACAGFAMALYHGLRWIARPGGKRALAAGAAVGFAIGCKFSCLMILPGLGVVCVGLWVSRRHRAGQSPGYRMGQLALIAITAFIVLWSAYLFDVGHLSDQRLFTTEPAWGRIPQALKDTNIPMPSFWLGLLKLTTHNSEGHLAYLNGQMSTAGWWYYFPEAFVLKTPVAVLSSLAISLLALVCSRRKRLRSLLVLVPAGGLFAAAIFGHLDIGIRHILPIFPALYVFIALQFSRRRWKIAMVGLITSAMIETGIAHPDYVSYFNVLAGGRGDRYLIDSNLDWGQDVARLLQWLDTSAAKGRPITFRVFGYNDDPPAVLGEFSDGRALPAGLLAISVNRLHGLDSGPDTGAAPAVSADYSFLSRFPVVARIGTSILVYDLDQPAGSGDRTNVP